jgi:Uma2 family endonuclease
MNILVQPAKISVEPGQRFMLWGIGWNAYEKFLEAMAEHRVRTTYARGDLELMSPLPIHEAIAYWFGHFIQVLAEELDFACWPVGGPTLRRRDLDRGLEPDDCYYLASAAKVENWPTLNLDRDPPPDLALEVEITCNCLDRMGVYAGLGVPEIWRFDGEEWHIHLLGADGVYQESPVSAAFPYLPIAELMPLLRESLHVGDLRERFRILRRWARERVLPLREAWQQQQQSPPPAANP